MHDETLAIDTSDIRLSKREIGLGFHLPGKLTENLSYFCGLLMGDGHLCFSPERGDYLINLGGNPKDERGFYDSVVVDTIKDLFGVELKPDTLSGGTYGIQFKSKSLLTFLITKLGMPHGNKCGIACIPEIFGKSEETTASFIQGFADADLSLYLRKRYKQTPYYPTIGGSSKSRRIIEQVSSFIRNRGITCSTTFDKWYFDKRTGKFYVKNFVYVYGVTNVFIWMKIIGFRNPKFVSVFEGVRNRVIEKIGSAPEVVPRYFRLPNQDI